MKPKISVVLPFYNADKYLDEAICSILKQSFKSFELILIDDGSEDNSIQIAQSLASKDKRIRIIQQENRGMAHSLNRGVEIAKADIIARMDGDDIAHKERLEHQYAEIIKMSKNALVSCMVRTFSKDKITEGSARYFSWVNSSVNYKEICTALFKESPFIHPSVVFTKNAFLKARGYKEYEGPEDYDLWLKMLLAGTEFSKTKQTLLSYRIHESNLSRCNTHHYHKSKFKERQFKNLLDHFDRGLLQSKREIVICNSGKEGRRLYNYLENSGLEVNHFIDVAQSKIGKRYKKTLIKDIHSIKPGNNRIYLSITGTWESESMIEKLFKERNLFPLNDYLIL